MISIRRSLLVLFLQLAASCCWRVDVGGNFLDTKGLLISLFLPPSTRLQLRQEQSFKEDCQRLTPDSRFFWDLDIDKCDYRLATKIFSAISSQQESEIESPSLTFWFPKLKDTRGLKNLNIVINENQEILGLNESSVLCWPEYPCAGVRLLVVSSDQAEKPSSLESEENEGSRQIAVENTQSWVTNKLCKLGLCPYTYSLQRAPVGLDSVGVREGPIVVRARNSRSNSPANRLARDFWEGVTELAETSEEKVATLLVVAPPYYDDKFLEFCQVFDNLLERSVQATGSEDIVGRAIFHPKYNSTVIGHTDIKPGHALPATMVESFVERYLESGTSKPDLVAIEEANDAVRWTPHATINLLRRSQLNAAKIVEAASPNKRPNWIYAKNVLRYVKIGENN